MKNSEPITKIFVDIECKGGQYIIDYWQRNYEWGKKQWMSMLETIKTNDTGKKWIGNFICYYPNGEKGDALVVDGQQRLTTLTIILAAIRDLAYSIDSNCELYRLADRRIKNGYNKNYIVYKNNPITQTVYEYITNGRVDSKYKGYSIYDAYMFYKNELSSYSIQELQNILDKLIDLQINYNICETELEAFEIFESVNSKGKHVSDNDNIKTLLCKIIDNHSGLSDSEKQFKKQKVSETTNDIISGTSFYSRYCYYKTEKWFAKAKIYHEISKCLSYEDIDNIFKLIDFENEFISSTKYFKHPSLVVVFNDCKKYNISNHQTDIVLDTLQNILIKNIIVGVGKCNIHEETFCTLIKYCVENQYFNLSDNDLKNKLQEAIDNKHLYKLDISIVDNNEFIDKLKTYNLYRAKHQLGRFILEKYNRFLENQSGSNEHQFVENISIDHISPQAKKSMYMHTIGNLTLLSQSANSAKNKKDINDNKVQIIIKESSLKINQELTKEINNVWDDNCIINRTNKIAEVLIKIM